MRKLVIQTRNKWEGSQVLIQVRNKWEGSQLKTTRTRNQSPVPHTLSLVIVGHARSSATGVASETAQNSESGIGDDGEKRN